MLVERDFRTFLTTPIAGAKVAAKSPMSVTVSRRVETCSRATLDCVTILCIFLTSASSLAYALPVCSLCVCTALTVLLNIVSSFCLRRPEVFSSFPISKRSSLVAFWICGRTGRGPLTASFVLFPSPSFCCFAQFSLKFVNSTPLCLSGASETYWRQEDLTRWSSLRRGRWATGHRVLNPPTAVHVARERIALRAARSDCKETPSGTD